MREPLATQKIEAESKPKAQAAAATTRAEVVAKKIDEDRINIENGMETSQKGIKAIDEGKHLFGGGTNAITRGYYDINPLATRPQEYIITQQVMGLFQTANLAKMATYIKGSYSDRDMKIIQRYQENPSMDPQEIRKALEAYQRASQKAYAGLQEAMRDPTKVPELRMPEPAAQPQQPRVGKYNPATGKVEY